MTRLLGECWEEFFSFININARKPLWQTGANPYYKVRKYATNLKGESILLSRDLNVTFFAKYFLEGSALLLTSWLQETLFKQNVKVLFLGTNYI
jgi:hypothetical protein